MVDGTWSMSYPNGMEMEEVTHTLSDYGGYRIDLGDDSLCGVFHAKTGKVVIPALYDYVRLVSENVFLAEERHDGTSTLIEMK